MLHAVIADDLFDDPRAELGQGDGLLHAVAVRNEPAQPTVDDRVRGVRGARRVGAAGLAPGVRGGRNAAWGTSPVCLGQELLAGVRDEVTRIPCSASRRRKLGRRREGNWYEGFVRIAYAV